MLFLSSTLRFSDATTSVLALIRQLIHKAFKRQKDQNIKIEFNMVNKKAGDEAVNTNCLFLDVQM